MEPFNWVTVLSMMLFIYLVFKKYYMSAQFDNIPGPPANFFFGNMLDFWGPTTKFLPVLIDYIKKYGRICLVHDSPITVALVVSDYKLLHIIYSSNTIIEKTHQYTYMWNWLGTGLLTSTGLKWKQRRRVLTPAFHFSILKEMVAVFESSGDILVKKLHKECGKQSIDIYPIISLYTLDAICEATMGTCINAQEHGTSEYVRSVKIMCKILVERSFSPLHDAFYPLTPSYYKEKKALKVLHEFTNSVIDSKLTEKRKKPSAGQEKEMTKRKAFLDLILECEVDGKQLSREDIREEVDTFMFEGHDTTSSAISFALYLIATHPQVQEQVLDEQKLIFGEELIVKEVTASQLQQMRYLENVLKETLRLYPSVPFIGRKLPQDLTYNGVVYTKGLRVMLFIYGAHRDPTYFADAEKFKPERFLTEFENPYMYTPFSAGPRNCIGQKFAMLEMKSAVSKIIRNFELIPPADDFKLQLAPETVLISKSGIRIGLKKRSDLM